MPLSSYLQAQKMDGLKVATDTYYVTDSEGNVSATSALTRFEPLWSRWEARRGEATFFLKKLSDVLVLDR